MSNEGTAMTEQPQKDNGDYCDERDIPKIISFLNRTSIRNGWDAHIGDGAGDCDIRIPAKYVQGFVDMLRSRPIPTTEELLQNAPTEKIVSELVRRNGKDWVHSGCGI
jgi:hypothetical protein